MSIKAIIVVCLVLGMGVFFGFTRVDAGAKKTAFMASQACVNPPPKPNKGAFYLKSDPKKYPFCGYENYGLSWSFVQETITCPEAHVPVNIAISYTRATIYACAPKNSKEARAYAAAIKDPKMAAFFDSTMSFPSAQALRKYVGFGKWQVMSVLP